VEETTQEGINHVFEKTPAQLEADELYSNKTFAFCIKLISGFFSLFEEDLDNNELTQEEIPYIVWDILVNKDKYAEAMPDGERFFLSSVAEELGGWVTYSDGKPKFVSSSIWLKRFNIWITSN
jgi:hypothetical protein